jgi:hypothetical protein
MNTSDGQQAQRTELMVALVNIALRTLSVRSIMVLALLLNTGVFSWAMYSESWVRLAGAALFAVTSWCTVNLKPPKENDHAS